MILYLLDIAASEWATFSPPDLPFVASGDAHAKTIAERILLGHSLRHGDYAWKCDLQRYFDNEVTHLRGYRTISAGDLRRAETAGMNLTLYWKDEDASSLRHNG